MNLHDYLPQRERDLLNELDILRGSIAAIQTKLIPLEAELANVRRAMSAIGISSVAGLGGDDSGAGLGVGLLGRPIVPPPADWSPPPSLLGSMLPSADDVLRSLPY